jgi:hypothetical protein
MPKLVGTGLNQVPMNAMLGSMAFQDTVSYFRAVQGTAVASTSGTSIDFTGIPVWAKRITVMFSGVSTNGTSIVEVRLGTSSGFVATGYLGGSGNLASGSAGSSSSSTGMRVDNIGSAAMARNGTFTCVLLTGNTWASTSIMADSTTALLGFAASSIPLSGALDRVRITTVNGTDAFDAGSINILYEG